jgi:acyl-CoA reductase-like NAD-dependent aldehyde dehydrogenase
MRPQRPRRSRHAMTRLSVKKTYKLYIGGAFPRSESGRTFEAGGHNVARASRKDARDAVRAARSALPGWAALTAYNRGQVLYRLAEMMEARAADLEAACSGRSEVEAAIDRTVWYAGWADKLAQVIGSSNPVAGPYFDFTIPEPTGVVAILAPSDPPLLGLVSRTLPALVGGNTVVVVAGEPAAIAAVELAEALATSDFPGGSVNVLTGFADELAPWLAGHMDVNAIDLTGVDGPTVELERSAAENVKRVIRADADSQSPWEISRFLELKTVWHPIGL